MKPSRALNSAIFWSESMNNAEIARVFEDMADLLELRGENAFRVRAYRNGAKALQDMPQSVAEILADGQQDLQSFPGIGSTLADKCKTLIETGKLPQLEELRANTPAVLMQMTRIPGLGAKKASVLQKELNLQSLEDLQVACEQKKCVASRDLPPRPSSSFWKDWKLPKPPRNDCGLTKPNGSSCGSEAFSSSAMR